MTRCAMLPLLVAALFSLPAASNAGPLDDVERMTATFLSQSDAGSLAYDEPQWRAAVDELRVTITERGWNAKCVAAIGQYMHLSTEEMQRYFGR